MVGIIIECDGVHEPFPLAGRLTLAHHVLPWPVRYNLPQVYSGRNSQLSVDVS